MLQTKAVLSLDKRDWHPSVLPGQIVIVSTVDAYGQPNLAPKSWITMAASRVRVVAFGCNTTHATCRNILETGEYVINIPGEPLADRIWALIQRHGADRVAESGFTLGPARDVRAPIVAECLAHLECRLDSVREFGEEVVIFGRIVAAHLDERCREGSLEQQYFALRPIFYLENGTYGSIDTAKRVGGAHPTQQALFVVEVGRIPAYEDASVMCRHVAFLQTLRRRGRLLMGGAFGDGAREHHGQSYRVGEGNGQPPNAGPRDGRPRGGGSVLYVIAAESRAAAEDLACTDPLVVAGGSVTVRPWTRTF